jgi:LacI family transcriptional regulator
MRAAALKLRIEESVNDFSGVEGVIRTECERAKPIDAIFAVRNLIAIYAFQVLQRLGLSIGKDVALIGFDDFELAGTLRPAVSVVRQPVEAMGALAANLLFKQMLDKTVGRAAPVKLRTSLILRSSCGCHSDAR